MKQIHSLFYKDGEEWKPLAYGDIITMTEPDEEKAQEPEALALLMEEPMTFTGTLTMTKKETKKLRRIFAPNKKEERRQRLRAAKRRNRERRLRKWKDGTAVMRQVVEIKRILKRGSKAWEAFIKSIVDTAIKIIDCVPAIPGIEWRTDGTSPDCIDDCEHCDYATCPKMEVDE